MDDSDSYEFDVPPEVLPWLEHQRESCPTFPLDAFILKNGRITKVHFLKWAEWFGDIENRRVDRTIIGGGDVSTVFLGIPHIGPGPAMDFLFETMVFGTGTEFDERQWRYRTMAEAKQGHWKVVDLVRQALT
jgi:hypothetical protein